MYRRGGGIVIYVKDGLPHIKSFNTELTSNSEDKTECVALELRLGGEKVLLMTVYNPPENDCSHFLEQKLSEYAVKYSNVVLIGDFNTDFTKPSRKKSNFEAVLGSFALQSIGEEPTFFHRDGCSQLDLFITSYNTKLLRFNQVSFPALSQHDLIFGSIDVDLQVAPNLHSYRDYVNFETQLVQNAISLVPWNDFYAIRDPDELLTFFNTHLKRIHDECIPLRTNRPRKARNAWFNSHIEKAILERDLAYGDWRKATRGTKEQSRHRYKILRNKVNTLIAAAKSQYMARFLDCRAPTAVLWKRLKAIGVGKEYSPPVSDFDLDLVNRTFISSFTSSDTRPQIPTPDQPHSFAFRPVQWWEVVNAICEIKSNAVGLDGLPMKFIKIVLPLVVEQITYLFNNIIETSTFPASWKHAKVLPIKKKMHLNSLTNLRPISILSTLSKAFEKLLKQQMTSFIMDNKLFTEQQAGFRKGHSIQTAVLRVHDDLARIVDRKGIAVLLLLDFSKAFDTIPHNKLCTKLKTQFNFSSSAVNLIQSYLSERMQTVFCGSHQSQSANVSSGVPQGSVIGPLLFCCFVNDLPTVLKYCSLQLYADDVQLYIGRLGPCARELIAMVNDDLERIARWSQQNHLLVNPVKSNALFINGRRRNAPRLDLLPPLSMDGQHIEWTESAKNLGFVFQTDLQWDGLINQQCGKIYASLRSCYACASITPVDTRLKLFKALILPHFLFGDIFHVNPSASALNKLRSALHSCIRYVYGLHRYSHVSHLQENLIGCPLENLYRFRSCMFVHKLITTRFPETLVLKLLPSRGQRLRNLVVPPNYTTNYSNTLFVRGVVNWNTLPPIVRQSYSKTVFKRGCLEFWKRY